MGFIEFIVFLFTLLVITVFMGYEISRLVIYMFSEKSTDYYHEGDSVQLIENIQGVKTPVGTKGVVVKRYLTDYGNIHLKVLFTKNKNPVNIDVLTVSAIKKI